MDKLLRTIATFCHKSKHHTEPIMIYPCPTNIGPKSEVDPMKSKGVAVDRHNTRFLDIINSGEKLSMAMGYQTWSPDRAKFGIENNVVKPTTPKKKFLHFKDPSKECNIVDDNPDVTYDIQDSEVK